jgi:asparagine synthase (glutamine-hydrolysing)
MSFFVAYQPHACQDRVTEFTERAAANGFRATEEVDHGPVRIVVFSALNGTQTAVHTTASGDFAIALGSLIHDGIASPDCLPGLLAGFSADSFAWRGLLGTHTLLIRKHERLHVFGDGLGASRLYTNTDRTLWSSSYLAMLEVERPTQLDRQACLEYVIAGSVYGDRSMTRGITALPANSMLTFDPAGTTQVRQLPSPISSNSGEFTESLDDAADYFNDRLDRIFAPIADNFGDRIRLSFSGGFDSRLMLAMLLRHGARPRLFVYGREDDEDVRIARLICQAENLELNCIDKSQAPATDRDALANEVERNLYAFDGWKVETPLFDFGADRRDRIDRHANGDVPLNGSLGEIYRNFYYMPDRPSSTGALVSTFYSQYDPRAFGGLFSEAGYRTGMQQAMRDAIGITTDRLQRFEVEQLYPNFRGRFWTGRDAQINQRFGPMFFPFLEPAAISDSARVPIGLKDLGRLQGRMISRINKRLADYPSDYGFPLGGQRPLKYRLKSFISTQRPSALRKLSFRLTRRSMQARGGALSPDYLGTVIDLDFPAMRGLFNIDRIHTTSQYGAVATLEYLAERYNLALPGD